MSDNELSPTQAEIRVTHFDTDSSGLLKAITDAVNDRHQFSAFHDGKRWTVSIVIPPKFAEVAELPSPEVA